MIYFRLIPIILLSGDFIAIFLHLITKNNINFFNLNMEQNFPTYYQGTQLLYLSMLCFTLFVFSNFIGKKNIILAKFWLFLTVIFSYLCIDEVGIIHENVYLKLKKIFPFFIENTFNYTANFGYHSAEWLLIYAPIILVVLMILYRLIGKVKYIYNNVVILKVGILILIFGFFAEYFGMKFLLNPVNPSIIELLSILEEASEMIGITIVIFFATKILIKTINNFRH